jgi:hypothetical protein
LAELGGRSGGARDAEGGTRDAEGARDAEGRSSGATNTNDGGTTNTNDGGATYTDDELGEATRHARRSSTTRRQTAEEE